MRGWPRARPKNRTPGSRDMRREGCTCYGRAGGNIVLVDPHCPLGHAKNAWGGGTVKPNSPLGRAIRKAGGW